MNLKKNLLKVFSANFLQTIVSILVGFIVPSILTLEGYADLKTYTLYMTYVGVLHFGFVDGLYLKYGGKELKDVSKGELRGEHFVLLLLQIGITLLFLIFSLICNDIVLFLMTISILPVNLLSFHKQYYQAIGSFELYSKILNIYSISYIFFNLLLVFVFRSATFKFYCLVNFLCNGLALLFAECKFYKMVYNEPRKISKKSFQYIKSGFLLMMGNLIAIFLYSIDKWFVKLFFSVEDFSYYSFAVSMFNIITILLNSICITFYNIFAKKEDPDYIKEMKNKLLIVGAFSSSAYFILSFIVLLFLPKYQPALFVIAYSFATFPYLFIIKAIYVNLYKSRKLEKRYTTIVIGMLVLSFALNYIAMLFNHSIYSIALATLIAFILWYFCSYYDFKYLKPNFFEILYLFLVTISFLKFSHINNFYIGFFGYIGCSLLFSFLFLKMQKKKQ